MNTPNIDNIHEFPPHIQNLATDFYNTCNPYDSIYWAVEHQSEWLEATGTCTRYEFGQLPHDTCTDGDDYTHGEIEFTATIAGTAPAATTTVTAEVQKLIEMLQNGTGVHHMHLGAEWLTNTWPNIREQITALQPTS